MRLSEATRSTANPPVLAQPVKRHVTKMKNTAAKKEELSAQDTVAVPLKPVKGYGLTPLWEQARNTFFIKLITKNGEMRCIFYFYSIYIVINIGYFIITNIVHFDRYKMRRTFLKTRGSHNQIN